MAMAEAAVQRWVKEYLEKEFGDKLYIFKVPQGQYASRRGIPDLVACVDGRYLAIEVKTAHGKLTKLQEYEIQKIRGAGGLAETVYGKDVPSMEIICKRLRG